MLSLTQPVRIDPQDIQLRNLAETVARGGKPEFEVSLPETFPKITLTMLVKNEWQTLRRAVQSVAPILDEIVIGVDMETDSPLSFAYYRTFELKSPEEAVPFFESFIPEQRYATFAEIAEFIGVPEAELVAECEQLAAARPTWKEAEECVEMIGKGEVIPIEFNNHFSNSRNKVLEKATGDLCMMIDGHEYMTHLDALVRSLMRAQEDRHFFRFCILLDEQDSPLRQKIKQERLFRRTPKAHYERGVHNRLVIPEEDEADFEVFAAHLEGPVLIHDRPNWLAHFRDPQRQQMTATHMGEGTDPSSLYFTALSAHRRKDYDRALEVYDQYLEAVKDGIESAYICGLAAKIHYDFKKDVGEAVRYALEGIRRAPDAAWCHVLLAHVALAQVEIVEEDKRKEDYLKKALAHVKLAQACEIPLSTISIPTLPYTIEPALMKAEILLRLGELDEAIPALHHLIELNPPPDKLEMAQTILEQTKMERIKNASASLRSPERNRLLIVDSDGQFHGQIKAVAEEMGYKVSVLPEFDINAGLATDVWWCDWADRNAAVMSMVEREDRRLIVRCHSYEVFTDMPSQINWDRVDIPIAASAPTLDKLVDKFGLDPDPIQILTVYPNPDDFPEEPPPIVCDKDVVFLGRFNSKKGVVRLPDLAWLVPDRTIHVGGTIQDERLYEDVVHQCIERGISNIRFYGHIDASEKQHFLLRGGNYISLSPWETYSVALAEAELMGLRTFVLKYPWTDFIRPTGACKSIESMAYNLQKTDRAEEGRKQQLARVARNRDRYKFQWESNQAFIREALTR